VHVFGYSSDLERADILFTSLLVQMARALAAQPAPADRVKAWRRSWMLGYCTAVVARVKTAEEAAAAGADAGRPAGADADGEKSTAVVLADRALVIRARATQAYPRTRKTRVTYSGGGYREGYAEGQKADIGGAKLRGTRGQLT
jgi:hypothetical protein